MQRKFVGVGKLVCINACDAAGILNADQQGSPRRVQEGGEGLQTRMLNGRIVAAGLNIPAQGGLEFQSKLSP